MSSHTWVIERIREFWEWNAPVGTLSVELRCSACNSVAQFTASGLHPCRGDEHFFAQWTALAPHPDDEDVGAEEEP